MKRKRRGLKRRAIQLDNNLYRVDVPIPGLAHTKLSVIDIQPEQVEQTIMLVHGYAGCIETWEYQINYFSRNYRVIAPDLRGHGQSDAPLTQYTMPELVADLQAITQTLELPEQFILAGHSFGGAICLEYATAYPERLTKLALIAPAGEYPLPAIVHWLARMPTAEIYDVGSAKHKVQLERHQAVNRAIERFITGKRGLWRESSSINNTLLQQRPWLAYYGEQTPPTVPIPSQPLHKFLESAADWLPKRTALIFYHQRYSYRRLNWQTNQFAHVLHGFGLKPGDQIIYPRDVEEVLYENNKVLEVVVVGVPYTNRHHQQITAFVVPRPGARLTAEELLTLCRRRLEAEAIPQAIEFRKALPKSFVGKVLRRMLVE